MIYEQSPPGAVSTVLHEVRMNLDLSPGLQVFEPGCGHAETAIALASGNPNVRFHLTDVDHQAIAALQRRTNLPDNMRFQIGRAESIELPDHSVDRVLMLKSLHHVPTSAMADALSEIHRILKPAGLALLLEPVYGGSFNDILKLFNDERVARQQAFETIRQCVTRGKFELVRQVFFTVEREFASFDIFRNQVMCVSHSDFGIDPACEARVHEAFAGKSDADGVTRLLAPQRLDLLCRA